MGDERGMVQAHRGEGVWPSLDVAVQGEGCGLAITHCLGLGILSVRRGSSINCNCFPVANFSDPWEALQARFQGSTGHIWPKGWRSSTPCIHEKEPMA